MSGEQQIQYKKALPMSYCTIAELLQATHQFKMDSADDKSPKLTLLPSGEAAHRVFLKGVLQEVKQTDNGITATFRDRTGKIFLRASHEFQPTAYAKLKAFKDLPLFCAVVGRVNLYSPPAEEGKPSGVFVSLNIDDIGAISKADRYTFDQDVLRLTRERVTGWNEPLTDLQQKAREMYGSGCEAGILQRIKSLYAEAGVTADE